MSYRTVSLRDVEVLVTNFKRRYTGVMSTIVNLVPVQARRLNLAVLGCRFQEDWPMTCWLSLLRWGWTKPSNGKEARIWHARRNPEMLCGVICRDLLRMRLKLVFTSAAQRDHTAWTKWLLRRMDTVIATSPESGSFLRVPYTVNMHGINTGVYHPSEDRAREWEETGLGGKYGIGVFGRVRHQKGTDRFVEIMLELLPKYQDWTAVIIGAVMPTEEAWADGLKAKIEAAGLTERINFLGLLPAEQVPGWLRKMTLVVGPQRNEGFGLVPAEAMGSGVAVVATKAGAAAHLIVEGHTGYLAEVEDIQTLKARIEELAANPKKSEAMGLAGREHVLKNFSVEKEAAGIEEIYSRMWYAGK